MLIVYHTRKLIGEGYINLQTYVYNIRTRGYDSYALLIVFLNL
jgi:hypothetical protein